MANYIYTACTDSSVSGITSANTSNFIAGYYLSNGQLTGCMSYAGVTTLSAETVEELSGYSIDCAECLDDYTVMTYLNNS
jgi:hypothetical protein